MSFILFRYFFIQTVGRSVLLLGMLLVLYGAIDYVETASIVSSSHLYRFYFYKLPQITSHMAPLVFAIGGLLTVSSMKNRGEWTGLEAAGISPVWFAAAILFVPVSTLPVGWQLTHQWAPASIRLFESAAAYRSEQSLQYGKSKEWIKLHVAGAKKNRVLLLQQDETGRAKRLIVREEQSGQTLHQWHSKGDRTVQHSVPSHVLKMPRTIPGVSLNGILGATVPSNELGQIGKQLEKTGVSSTSYQAVVALRQALVAAIVVVPMAALLLFLSISAHSSLMAVVIAIVTGGTYWVSLLMGWTMVQAGALPVWTVWASGLLGTTITTLFGIGIGSIIRMSQR